MARIVTLVGPSGVGKSKIEKLVAASGVARRAVSTTTRPMRGNERADVDYHYISREEFLDRLADGRFIEHTEYSGNLYGLTADELRQGRIVTVVDGNGAKMIKSIYPSETRTVFVRPPSDEDLVTRMKARGDDEKAIRERMGRIGLDYASESLCDMSVVNDDLDETVAEIIAIFDQEDD